MTRLLSTIGFTSLVWLLGASLALAKEPGGREGHGFIGYGITRYKPACASACRDVVSAWPLNCSTSSDPSAGMSMNMSMPLSKRKVAPGQHLAVRHHQIVKAIDGSEDFPSQLLLPDGLYPLPASTSSSPSNATSNSTSPTTSPSSRPSTSPPASPSASNSMSETEPGEGSDDEQPPPSPACLATNDPFLQTLAYCVNTHCKRTDVATLESWWQTDAVGRDINQPMPKESYQMALGKAMMKPPRSVLNSSWVLNATSLVDEESWKRTYDALSLFEESENGHETYGIALLVSTTAVPILASLFRLLPLPPSYLSSFYAHLIDSPLFGRHHAVPVLGLGFIPTRGQSLMIAYIVILNTAFLAVGHRSLQPNSWFSSSQTEIITYLANRAGVLSFANLPLLVLFAGRNNILLVLSSWSHATFLLLHRYIAFFATLHASIHSGLYLYLYTYGPSASEDGGFSSISKTPFWIWGSIGTLAMVLLIAPFSLLAFRRKLYEFFLASHVILSIAALAGCLMHIWYRFRVQYGYETWLYMTFAIWGFDRLLARPARLMRNGVKRAYVTELDREYLRVDITGLNCTGGTAYLYFPSLTWRVWENHPFSMAGHTPQAVGAGLKGKEEVLVTRDEEVYKNGRRYIVKTHVDVVEQRVPAVVSGTTFFIRRRGGMTERLASAAGRQGGIPVLVESAYGDRMSVIPENETRPSADYPHLLCIAGGVGITGILPILDRASGLLQQNGSLKLYWGSSSSILLHAVEEMVHKEDDVTQEAQLRWRDVRETRWGNAQVVTSIGARFDLKNLLESELGERSGKTAGTIVVVCGPPGMSDEIRCCVTGFARGGAVVRLVDERFGW